MSKIKFSQASESEGVDSSDLSGNIRDLADLCEGLTFSTGNSDGNLKGNSIVDAGVGSLEIKQVNAKGR